MPERGQACCLCSFMMEYDIHTVLDLLTLLATGWVIYTLLFQLWDTYQADQDVIKSWMVVRGSIHLPISPCWLPAHCAGPREHALHDVSSARH
jgi:hypothetical protein